MKRLMIIVAVLLVVAAGCSFSEFSQDRDIAENIDEYRTGCEVDSDTLMTDYKQWNANRHHYGGGPTPTPSAIKDYEISISAHLETVWEHGCETGRRDTVGAEQTTLKGLRDQLNVLDNRLAALEEAEKATATPTQ